MVNVLDLTPEEAREFLLKKKKGAIRVEGLIDLRGTRIGQLSASISCHGLDASGSDLTSLPADIQIESRLILDDCTKLESLPQGLECGSISLRNCGYLNGLPEGITIEATKLDFTSNSATGANPASPTALDWTTMIDRNQDGDYDATVVAQDGTYTATDDTVMVDGRTITLTDEGLSIGGTLTLDIQGFYAAIQSVFDVHQTGHGNALSVGGWPVLVNLEEMKANIK